MRVTINMDDSLYLELLDLSKAMNRSLSGQVVNLVKTHGELVGKMAWDKLDAKYKAKDGPVPLGK